MTTRGCRPARQAWTDYIIVTNDLHRNSWWIIRTVGLDFAEKLSAKLEQLGPEPESAFLCYLNMRSEGAEECWKLLRDSGFFLSGFKPANLDGEFAIFTYLGGRKLETADIQLSSENRWLLYLSHIHIEMCIRDRHRPVPLIEPRVLAAPPHMAERQGHKDLGGEVVVGEGQPAYQHPGQELRQVTADDERRAAVPILHRAVYKRQD